MMFDVRRGLFWLLAGCLVAGSGSPLAAQPAATDVRVLIDISGSMKNTDPQNLRSPALRLLVGSLPADSQSGVWTFGKYVNMLVKHGAVTEAWRSEAIKASEKINSVAQFTNLELVLERATRGWSQPENAARRSLILLTDGMVDVAPDASVNQVSRQRIIDTFVPRMRQAGVTVHSIALSAEADHELLALLSESTEGWYERVENADELHRVFLRMFEKAAPRDTLPIEGNRFSVDSSVEELTLLVFRRTDAEPTGIVMPDGTRIDNNSGGEGIKWLHENQFDLVTVSAPAAGEWQIIGEADPDNRAMIITSLALDVTALPNQVTAGERFPLEVSLTEKGQVVERQDLLSLVSMQIQSDGPEGMQWRGMLLDDGATPDRVAGDGVYTVMVEDPLQTAGDHSLQVTVDGKTFQRAHTQVTRVSDMPVVMSVSRLEEDGWAGNRVTWQVDPGLVELSSVSIQVAGLDDAGNEYPLEPVVGEQSGVWQLDVADDPAVTGIRSLMMDVNGRNFRERPFNVGFGRVVLDQPVTAVEPVPPPDAALPVDEELAMVAPVESPVEAGTPWLAIGIAIAANILLLLGGGIGYWMWRRGSRTPGFGLDEVPA